MTKYLLGIDVGTYSSKGVITTLAGEIVASAVVEHGISVLQAGYVEQDADQVWWHDTCALSRALLARSGLAPEQVAAVALSAIGPCLLPLDSHMRPLRPAILYGVDMRAAQQVEALEAEMGSEEVLAFSRMAFTSQAIGPKIRWLREQQPALWRDTAMLTSATAYLVYRMTGQHRLDHHSASYFMPLYNPASAQWDTRHAHLVCPLSLLPPLAWADEVAGTISAQGATQTGLAAGTPVAVGTVDALSEALSVGVAAPGDMMVMHGSSTFFIGIQQQATPDARVWSTAGLYQGQVNLAAGMATSGSLTRWFKDEFCRDLDGPDAYDILFREAATVAPGSSGLLVLPYFSGERSPINDPRARGEIIGLSLAHQRKHIFRAILEGVGFGIRHNLETFGTIGVDIARLVAVGGGAQSDIWLQIISDITGREQVLPHTTIGASYGDAFLAGCAAGLLQREQLAGWIRPGRVIRPDAAHRTQYDALYAHYRDLYRSTRDIVHALA